MEEGFLSLVSGRPGGAKPRQGDEAGGHSRGPSQGLVDVPLGMEKKGEKRDIPPGSPPPCGTF